MESSSTSDQQKQKLKTLRIQCKKLGITAEEERLLDFLASGSIPMAITSAEGHIAKAEEKAELEKEKAELEGKNAQLEGKKAELQGKNAELEKEKAEVEKEKAELEGKNAELEGKNAELEKEKAENSKLVEVSIENTYGKTIEDFKQPPIELNTAVMPSVGVRTRTTLIQNSEGEEEKVTMKVPEVNIHTDCKGMWVDVSHVTIPVVEVSNGKEIKKIKSIIGAKWNPPSKFTYANEFNVQAYCDDMIRDALNALGLIEKADTHLEFSMYLMKPDIVIVVKHHGRIFFAVEVKSPELEGEEKVFGNERVAGQIWSYLYAMKASGNPCPIGAIMTYNKISIVTLEDYTEKEEGEEGENHKARIEAAKLCLSTGISPQRELPKAEKEKCESRDESPIKPIKDFSNTNQGDNEEMQRKLWEEQVERNAYCSRVHQKGEVFPCLLQAIDIAYRAICDADSEQIVCVAAKTPIGRRLVFKLGADSFDWVRIGGNVCAKIDGNIPNSATKHLYILGKLGDGRIASVYLACSVGGKVCAIKDYCIERSSAAGEKERNDEENAARRLLIKKAEEEKGRWAEIYDRRFQARAQCFGGKHCLLMPYGNQIGAEPDDRWRHVPGIKKELELFARCTNGRSGYKYKKSDLRWRHVLLDSDKKVFLCDLESLEKIDNATDCNEVVYKQLAILLNPMRNTAAERRAFNWVCDADTAHVVSFICGIGTLKDFFFVEGSSSREHIDSTELCGKIQSLFPSAATFEQLSTKPEALVTICMISHYWNEQKTKKRQREESPEGGIPVPALVDSKRTESLVATKMSRRRS